eukprot:gnl/TRDRNA2_/TRDRNA2_178017_c0_seq1.p1 gnl/TRDRNA2_/TRDRNA2_178017_c0~~gnl/TRDRNA2_/TRDRNA2_178017_c0_seq1.p1  ORF type:complete len:867 (+),score=-53.29 gnl/TRDRNA2_/TRDRNA2_178017_c0_seq1:347-2947(+)
MINDTWKRLILTDIVNEANIKNRKKRISVKRKKPLKDLRLPLLESIHQALQIAHKTNFFYDGFCFETFMDFIKILGMHTCKNLRYLGTLIMTQLLSTWINILKNLKMKTIDEFKQNKRNREIYMIITKYIILTLISVCPFRFRDLDIRNRNEIIQRIPEWIVNSPNLLLKKINLKYLIWAILDRNLEIARSSIAALVSIFEKCSEYRTAITSFTTPFYENLIKMSFEKDEKTVISVLNLITSLTRENMTSFSQVKHLSTLLIHNSPFIRSILSDIVIKTLPLYANNKTNRCNKKNLKSSRLRKEKENKKIHFEGFLYLLIPMILDYSLSVNKTVALFTDTYQDLVTSPHNWDYLIVIVNYICDNKKNSMIPLTPEATNCNLLLLISVITHVLQLMNGSYIVSSSIKPNKLKKKNTRMLFKRKKKDFAVTLMSHAVELFYKNKNNILLISALCNMISTLGYFFEHSNVEKETRKKISILKNFFFGISNLRFLNSMCSSFLKFNKKHDITYSLKTEQTTRKILIELDKALSEESRRIFVFRGKFHDERTIEYTQNIDRIRLILSMCYVLLLMFPFTFSIQSYIIKLIENILHNLSNLRDMDSNEIEVIGQCICLLFRTQSNKQKNNKINRILYKTQVPLHYSTNIKLKIFSSVYQTNCYLHSKILENIQHLVFFTAIQHLIKNCHKSINKKSFKVPKKTIEMLLHHFDIIMTSNLSKLENSINTKKNVKKRREQAIFLMFRLWGLFVSNIHDKDQQRKKHPIACHIVSHYGVHSRKISRLIKGFVLFLMPLFVSQEEHKFIDVLAIKHAYALTYKARLFTTKQFILHCRAIRTLYKTGNGRRNNLKNLLTQLPRYLDKSKFSNFIQEN